MEKKGFEARMKECGVMDTTSVTAIMPIMHLRLARAINARNKQSQFCFITLHNQWLKWKCRGGGTVISGFGPLLVVVGPLLTVLDHFALFVVAAPRLMNCLHYPVIKHSHSRLRRGFES